MDVVLAVDRECPFGDCAESEDIFNYLQSIRIRPVSSENTPPASHNGLFFKRRDERLYCLFQGPKSFLSNFCFSPFVADGVEWKNVSQYYQYCKADHFRDMEVANQILATSSAYEAKRMGRRVKGFKEYEWNSLATRVMTKGIFEKFYQNPVLLLALCHTGNAYIVEAGPVNERWASGISIGHKDDVNPINWKGENRLGKILTLVREILQ